jgi:2,4'-dihydroxyacetophenone dioxygenase
MIDTESSRGGTNVVPGSAAPWAEVTEGVEIRMLRAGGGSGHYTAMFRFRPGTRLPKHHHMGAVHAYTLSGSWRYLEYDWVAGPGSYVYEEPGSVHTLVVPDDATEPAVVLFVVESGMVLIADDGSLQLIWDARAMDDLYRATLENNGLPYPPEVLP